MKKILTKSKNTFLSLLLLCFVSTILSASLPFNSVNSTSGTDGEEVETKTTIINESIDPENNIHNDFTECTNFNNQIHELYSNKTNNSTPHGMMGLNTIECPEDTVLSVGIVSCFASAELAIPTNIQGLCGGNQFSAETFEGGTLNVMGSLENGDLAVFADNFGIGTHHIQYMVNDTCGNVFNCEFEVVVVNINAVVVVKQNIVIGLSPTSVAGVALSTIYPENIDNGSHNLCSPIKLEIRKDVDLCGIPGNATYNADGHPEDGDPNPNSTDYDPDNGQSITFCCEDLTSALYDVDGDGINDIGYIKVWLRVLDDTNLDSIPGNEGDSYNEAWTFIKVEDQLTPAITCPPDVTLTCDMDYTDLGMTGSAIGYGSCGELGVEYNDIIVNLNTCNVGFLTRRWNVVGRTDIFCDQTITMEDVDAPVNVSFSEVIDFTTANCPDLIALGEPTWEAGPCDVIGYTIDTDTFSFEDGACYKLVNHYTLINWCDYTPTDPTWNGEGLWEHIQIVKVIDETKPVIADCEDKIFAINDHSDSDDDGITCEAKIILENSAIDEGSENCPSGWLHWQVIVDLYGDGTNDLEYSSFLPPFDDLFNDTNGNGIPDVYLSPTSTGDTVSISLPDLTGALSSHKVYWKVTDGCGNVTTCDYAFLISDQTSPTATCQDSITVGLSPIGVSRLWAINYFSDAMDNCSSTENIRYTFSASPPEDDPSYDPDRLSSNYVLTLNDINNGYVQLPIYIWDEKGNFTACETVFIIDPDQISNTEESTGIHTNLLYQNQPNPFRLSTSVSFNLDRDTPVKLSFMNATSAKTLEIEIAGKQGLNTYVLDRDLLSGHGLYYYTMTTKYNKETKKMILIH